MAGKQLQYEIKTTGKVDGSVISGFRQIQDAMKTMSQMASESSSSMGRLNAQLQSQNSVITQVSSAFQRLAADGKQGTATYNEMAAALISASADAEQTTSAIERGNQALEMLNHISAEAKAEIQGLTQTISEQKSHLDNLQNQYDTVAEAMGEDSQEAQDLKAQIETLNSELQQNQQKLQEVTSAALKSAEAEMQYKSATQQLQESISEKSQKLSELKEKYTEAYLSTGKWSKETRSAAKEIKQLSSSLADDQAKMQAATSAADSFDRSLNEISSSSSGAQSGIDAMSVALGNMISRMAGFAWDKIKDFGKGIFETGMGFESQMSKVAGLAGISKTDDAFIQLSNAAKEAGRNTIYSATEAGQALEYMALAGWDTQQSVDALTPMLKLAAAGSMELGETSDLITDYMSAFSGSQMSVEQFANKLAIASTTSNTSVAQLGEAYKNSAASMNSYGQSVESTTAALMVMANQGVKGGIAGTYLNNMMSDLITHAKDGKVAIGDASIQIADAEGNFLQLTDIVGQLDDAFGNLSEADRADALSKVFGKQALKGVNNLLNAGKDQLNEYANSLSNETIDSAETDALTKMYETQTDNLESRVAAFKSAMESIQNSIYEALEPYLNVAMDWINNFVQGIAAALDGIDFSQFGSLVPIIAGIGTAAVGVTAAIKGWNIVKSIGSMFSRTTSEARSSTSRIGSFFDGLGSAVSGVIESIGTSFQTMCEGIGSLNFQGAASFAIVVGTLTAAFAALALVGEPVVTLLDGIGQAFSNMVSGVLMGFADALVRCADIIPIVCSGLSQLSPLVVAIGEAIGATAPAIQALGTAISDIVVSIGEALATILSAILPFVEPIGQVFNTFVQIVSDAIVAIIDALAPYADQIARIVEATSQAVQAVCEAFSTLLSNVAPIISSISELVGSLGSAIHEALDGVADVIRSVGDAIRSALDGVADIISACGQAFIDAGVGFILMATGAKKLSECNLITLGAGLLELAAGMTAIGGASWVFNDAGDKMLTFAVGVEKLADNSSKMPTVVTRAQQMVQGLGQLGPSLSEAASAMTSAGAQIDSAVSSINQSLAQFNATGAQATSIAMMITQGFNQIGIAATTGASMVMQGVNMATSGFRTLASTATSSMTRVSQVITVNLNKAQATIRSFISQAVASFRSGMAQIQASVSSTFASLASYVQAGMSRMVASAQAGINQLRAIMNTTIESPRVKVPHFSISGKLDIESGSVPTVHVSYYKKGGIMTDPTIFGWAGNTALVGGEAGPEGIVPLDPLWERLDSIEAGMARLASTFTSGNSFLAKLAGMDDGEFQGTLGACTTNNVSNASSGDFIYNPQITIELSPTASADPQAISATLKDTLILLADEMKEKLFEEMQELKERSYGW